MSVKAHDLISRSRYECSNLIEFTKLVRGPDNNFSGRYSVKTADLDRLFRNTLWKYQKTKNGHQKWIHPVTRVVVEYVDRENDIDPGAVTTVLDQVQKHINILGNDIFQFKKRNWKDEPNMKAAVERFEKLKSPGG